MVVEIFSALSIGGISSYLIYRQDLTKREQSTVFWTAATFGFICFLLFNAVAPSLLALYSAQFLSSAIAALSPLLLMAPISSQYQSVALRDFRHSSLAKLEICCRLTSFSFALLTIEWGLFCLVATTVLYSLLRLLGLIALYSNLAMLSFGWSTSVFKDAGKYGAYAMGGQLLNVARRQLDSILLAGILSLSDFGIYSLVRQIASKPARLLQPVFTRIALPSMGKWKHARERALEYYEYFFILLAVSLAAAYIPLIVVSDVILSVVYGATYREQHFVLSLLGLFWLIRVAGSTLLSPVIEAFGKTRYSFVWNLLLLPTTAVVLAISAQYGVVAVCLALLILQMILFPLSQRLLVGRLIPVSLLRLYVFLALSIGYFVVLLSITRFVTFESDIFNVIWVGLIWGLGVLVVWKTRNPATNAARSLGLLRANSTTSGTL